MRIVITTTLCVFIMTAHGGEKLRESWAEEGSWYQGDLDLPGEEQERNAILYRWQRWPKGVVHYEIDSSYTPGYLDVI